MSKVTSKSARKSKRKLKREDKPYRKWIVRALILLGIVILAATTLFLTCDRMPDGPIKVVQRVKVGMTRLQVAKVVNIGYFTQHPTENKTLPEDSFAYYDFAIEAFEVVADSGEDFRILPTNDVDAPYLGALFFYPDRKASDPAVVVYRRTVNDGDALWVDDISPDDVVVGVSNIPFSAGQEIVEEVTGRPYRR
ncbi:MAG: hypothetical protein QF737_00045 [Dehalococcoidales bacterium]|nr:hypothetical protein [Dehalococcoidales bacterium]